MAHVELYNFKFGSGSGPGNGSGTSGVIVPAPGLLDLSDRSRQREPGFHLGYFVWGGRTPWNP